MTSNPDPQDAVPADDGTVHLHLPPEDAPQDAVPAEPGTVRLGRTAVPGQASDPDVVPTVRLPAEPGTVRLGRAVGPGEEPEAVPTVRLPAASEAAAPTPTLRLPVEPQLAPAPAPGPAPTPTLQLSVGGFAAEEVAPQAAAPVAPAAAAAAAAAVAAAAAPEAAAAAAAAAPDPGLIRFGPGVPDPKTARTIAVWKGQVAPEPQVEEEKRRRGWLFWVPVLLVFLALLGWWLSGLLNTSPLKITAASVQVTPTTLSCDGKATITATVTTDGAGGTFHYRWVRSDGSDSGLLTENVAEGTRSVELPLIWSLSGPGTFSGKATLEIENHPALTESASFTYSCNG